MRVPLVDKAATLAAMADTPRAATPRAVTPRVVTAPPPAAGRVPRAVAPPVAGTRAGKQPILQLQFPPPATVH